MPNCPEKDLWNITVLFFAKYSVSENGRKLVVDASFVLKYKYKSRDLEEKTKDSKTLTWISKIKKF